MIISPHMHRFVETIINLSQNIEWKIVMSVGTWRSLGTSYNVCILASSIPLLIVLVYELHIGKMKVVFMGIETHKLPDWKMLVKLPASFMLNIPFSARGSSTL